MIRSIKGIKDILPSHSPKWQTLESRAHELARRFGFMEIRIPIFEQTELFSRSIGGATDIVEKEMYTFPDRDGTSLTLRPEGTAGVVRAFLEHSLANQFASRKLYYIGPMFRHERPQAGRFRQFQQFGVEAFGTEDPLMDVEIITLLWQYFSLLGLQDLTLHINSIGTLNDRHEYLGHLRDFLLPHLDKLCGNCRRRIDTNPLRILDCKVPHCRSLTDKAPALIDHLSPPSASHFREVLQNLALLKIPYTIDHRLVRGLDYYSMTTFEVTSPALGAQNTIGAGGRYDGLVEMLGGPPTPAVGFAIGLDRVSLVLPENAISPPSPLVFVAGFGEAGQEAGVKLLQEIRNAGITADTDYRASTLKNLLRSADRLSASITIILGDTETKKGTAILRDMVTKKQEEIPISKVIQTLTYWINPPSPSQQNS
ncbi:MAG: histidine--tRNA ligase [Nitrospirota bacterium]|nr:MAG: histidine--tRNA ligase [Nitrospirota bacterium]